LFTPRKPNEALTKILIFNMLCAIEKPYGSEGLENRRETFIAIEKLENFILIPVGKEKFLIADQNFL
jgi:hypothetical protein